MHKVVNKFKSHIRNNVRPGYRGRCFVSLIKDQQLFSPEHSMKFSRTFKKIVKDESIHTNWDMATMQIASMAFR